MPCSAAANEGTTRVVNIKLTEKRIHRAPPKILERSVWGRGHADPERRSRYVHGQGLLALGPSTLSLIKIIYKSQGGAFCPLGLLGSGLGSHGSQRSSKNAFPIELPWSRTDPFGSKIPNPLTIQWIRVSYNPLRTHVCSSETPR